VTSNTLGKENKIVRVKKRYTVSKVPPIRPRSRQSKRGLIVRYYTRRCLGPKMLVLQIK